MANPRSEVRNVLLEAAVGVEEIRKMLLDAAADPKDALVLVPKAIADMVDILALLQDEIIGDAKIVGLDFPTKLGARYHRMQNGQ